MEVFNRYLLFFNKKAPHFREGLFLSYPTRTRTLNVCTKNRSVAITPSDNSPFRDGKYTPIDKLHKRVTQNFQCLTIFCSAEGLDFLIFGAITRSPILELVKKYRSVNYKKLNTIVGWAIFGIATFTYFMTIEPTTSFWDCGEYIATSVKLQVGHPPGAPFFQLMGNLFSQLASSPENQALMVNALSALSSSFSILFLFWTITALSLKLLGGKEKLDNPSIVAVLGAGAVGALAYTFSDSFWFSAVEGEVYAMSSFFTAAAFWAILKWEQAVDEDPHANRWLLLIAYLVGLSIGVHILVFLTIPAISMIYYFKKNPNPTRNGFIVANATGIGVLAIVFALIIPMVLRLFSTLEITFVNSFGMPFHSGTIAATVILTASVVAGLVWTKRKERPLAQQAVLAIMLLVMGYSTFIILAIRSNANTPIDENNPEDAMSLLAYYNREQYGDWPILYGKSFNAPYDRTQPFDDGTPVYQKGFAVMKGPKQVTAFKLRGEAEDYIADKNAALSISAKYLLTDEKKASKPNYDPKYQGSFPRIWNDDPQYKQNYINIMGITDPDKPITFAQNVRFFFEYQVGKMWWRYFMWNFSGKQNDQQHRYELTKGNWITGIGFIDSIRLGNQDNLPQAWKDNPSRNSYFMLPFVLGVFGIWYQFKKNNKDAWAVTLFFLLTGIAIVVYTNHKPFEPRERDYAFVGSFYAFAIWIGIGALGLWDLLRKKMSPMVASYLVIGITMLAVPVRMAAENWDDHDRSNRYTARDIAKAYLDSCDPNAILFTNGDNDTFPLWYVQEVEGYRTDVRVVNLSLLNTDWYIDQQRRKAYDGEAVPFSFEWNQYVQGTRDVLYYRDMGVKGRWDVKDFVEFTKRDDAQVKFKTGGNKELPLYPQKKLRISIDKDAVLANGVVDLADSAKVVDYIDWDWKSNVITKRDLMVIDLIANNNWERPIYFSITVGNSAKSFFWLNEYFRLEGMAYRFVPVFNPGANSGIDFGKVDTEIMYDNLINKFSYGNMELPDVYLDETNRRLSYNLRTIFGRLANEFIAEGNNEKAVEVLDFAMDIMPSEKFGYNYFLFGIIDAYYRAGALDQARELTNDFADLLDDELLYFEGLSRSDKKRAKNEWQTDLQFYQMLFRNIQTHDNENTQSFYQRYLAAANSFQNN